MIRKKIALSLLSCASSLALHAGDPFFNDPFGDDIFQEMMQMQRDMDRMFGRIHQRSTAMLGPIGTYRIAQQSQFVDRGDRYTFKTDIPESKENSINISVSHHTLNIQAKVLKTEEANQGGMHSYQSYVNIYQRSLSLPADADKESMKSAYVDGYLTIVFQKNKQAQKARPKVRPTQQTAPRQKPSPTSTPSP
jgi:HSP20 family protein